MAAEPAEVKKADEPAAAAASAATPAPAATTAVLPTVAAAPATVAVKKGPLKISLELDGVFEAQTASEIVVKPEEWTVMSVLEAVPHGARVRKGDVLLKFDTEKLDHVIADLRTELKLAELACATVGRAVAGVREDHALGPGSQRPRAREPRKRIASTSSTSSAPSR